MVPSDDRLAVRVDCSLRPSIRSVASTRRPAAAESGAKSASSRPIDFEHQRIPGASCLIDNAGDNLIEERFGQEAFVATHKK